MLYSVVKSIVIVSTTMFALLGAATFGTGCCVVCGVFSVPEVAAAVQKGVDYTNWGVGTLVITLLGTIVRAATPHVVRGVREWFAAVIKAKIEEALK